MSRSVKAESDWFSIRTDAGGDEYVASTGDEVLVVPLTDSGEVLLAVEPSPAFGVPVPVLPGGQVELDLTLAEVANRDLREEIGYRAGRLDSLDELWPLAALEAWIADGRLRDGRAIAGLSLARACLRVRAKG